MRYSLSFRNWQRNRIKIAARKPRISELSSLANEAAHTDGSIVRLGSFFFPGYGEASLSHNGHYDGPCLFSLAG